MHLSKNKASSIVYLDFSLSCKPVLCAHKSQVSHTIVNRVASDMFLIWERHNLGSWEGQSTALWAMYPIYQIYNSVIIIIQLPSLSLFLPLIPHLLLFLDVWPFIKIKSVPQKDLTFRVKSSIWLGVMAQKHQTWLCLTVREIISVNDAFLTLHLKCSLIVELCHITSPCY